MPADGWRRISPYCEEHASGCRVTAARLGARWRFSAWGAPQNLPKLPPVRYARGEAVPVRRPLLGCFDTAEAARAACLAHLSPRLPEAS